MSKWMRIGNGIGALTLPFVLACASTALAAPTLRKGTHVDKRAATPKYKSAWKMDLPADTQRVAIADVTEDKKPRLLVLDKDGNLTVTKLTDTGSAKEGTIALGKDAARFVTGHFAAGKPALIVVPGAVYYKDGDKYSKKDADLTDFTGAARFIDGTEVIFVLSKDGPPTSYVVDLSAVKPLIHGKDLPQPDPDGGQFREILAMLPQEMLEQESFPDAMKRGGIVRLVDPASDNRIFGLVAWQEADSHHVALLEGSALFPKPIAEANPVWKSPQMSGKVLDIAIGPDPKGSKQTGFLVLASSGDGGKNRVLEFFAVE